MMKNNKINGFTLTELIITLAIAAIFVTVAVPGYYSLIQNNKTVSMVNKLSASLNYARIEAIKRGMKVSICSAANAALTACGTAGQWAQGWIVFVDANNDNTINSTTDLLKVNEALPSNMTINSSTSIISYDGTGFVTNGAVNMTITAPGCTGNNGRSLNVTSSGRVSITNIACS